MISQYQSSMLDMGLGPSSCYPCTSAAKGLWGKGLHIPGSSVWSLFSFSMDFMTSLWRCLDPFRSMFDGLRVYVTYDDRPVPEDLKRKREQTCSGGGSIFRAKRPLSRSMLSTSRTLMPESPSIIDFGQMLDFGMPVNCTFDGGGVPPWSLYSNNSCGCDGSVSCKCDSDCECDCCHHEVQSIHPFEVSLVVRSNDRHRASSSGAMSESAHR